MTGQDQIDGVGKLQQTIYGMSRRGEGKKLLLLLCQVGNTWPNLDTSRQRLAKKLMRKMQDTSVYRLRDARSEEGRGDEVRRWWRSQLAAYSG